MIDNQQGVRLITQNLLTSAAVYEQIPRRSSKQTWPIDWASLRDLCVLIDLFCLYDKVVVLGREANAFLAEEGPELFSLLNEQKFVHIEHIDPEGEIAERISRAAGAHLRAFLARSGMGIGGLEGSLGAFLTPREVAYGLQVMPDTEGDFVTIADWLRKTPSYTELLSELQNKRNFIRAFTFLVRTFLYLGYHDVQLLGFTPDAARADAVGEIVKEEEHLRTHLLDTMRHSFKTQPLTGTLELRRTVTPLASIVFSRASPNKSNIVKEMQRLRDELSDLRERLALVEAKMMGSYDEQWEAELQWRNVFDEIERRYGKGEALISAQRLLRFADIPVGLAFDYTNPQLWIKAILDLPSEIVTRLFRRRPMIEIYRLARAIPGNPQLRQNILDLFGDIVNYSA